MKRNILLLQFRENKLVARHEEKCILKYLGRRANLISKNVFLDDFNFSDSFSQRISAVILGGSNFSFSERGKYPSLWGKIKKITPFLKKIIKKNVSTLGICFGHQYLAYVLRAKIIKDESQQEIGTFKVSLTKKGRADDLFRGIPSKFFVQEAHKDSIKKLPQKTILLAEGKRCKIQAFRYKNIYGVQFHPELNIKDMRLRSSFYPGYIVGETARFKPTPFCRKVFENFFDTNIKN